MRFAERKKVPARSGRDGMNDQRKDSLAAGDVSIARSVAGLCKSDHSPVRNGRPLRACEDVTTRF
jgi:hypothetical protein